MNNTSINISDAVDILGNGGIVSFPTDTAYCLAADIFCDDAIKRVFEVKGRMADKAMPIFIPDKQSLPELAIEIPDIAWKLADAFWPGGLTMVVKKHASLSTPAIAEGETVALRVPGHAIALEIVRKLGKPVTGTSANLSGSETPVTASQVRKQLGNTVDMIIDGGKCPGTAVSTIIDITGPVPKVLRQGAVPKQALEEICGLAIV
ncbi:MAG: threonylcarbamoyl-AMP synthase [Chloroflexi bacterium]|jgi:L-threonylcarbamoyladenylate synthase|nr:threonylcarbamoyl-AMP synthase [Chloroflexota bacterium]MBT7082351.1 threonylcarbamoyl-AMP synthase [Chloroflexota bacterium]MBT7289569.1 threonylcarbamoyl-AMP synthase [Chloroflexota bacterium]